MHQNYVCVKMSINLMESPFHEISDFLQMSLIWSKGIETTFVLYRKIKIFYNENCSVVQFNLVLKYILKGKGKFLKSDQWFVIFDFYSSSVPMDSGFQKCFLWDFPLCFTTQKHSLKYKGIQS